MFSGGIQENILPYISDASFQVSQQHKNRMIFPTDIFP
jgi:hypothetical protein